MSEPENQEQPEAQDADRPDAPNKQAVGLDPPWVEGEGGEAGEAAAPAAAAESAPPLDAMNKEQLLEHARSLGVKPANNDMTKEELRAAIDAHNA